MTHKITLHVGPRNGKADRLVIFQKGDREYRDSIVADSGFAREKAIQRAATRFGVPVEQLGHLDAEIVQKADEEDARADKGGKAVDFEPITCAKLMATAFDIRFLVDRIVVAGQPLIVAGPQKSLKTNLLIDLALSVATGGFFLGKFRVSEAATVVLMTGESGLPTVQETIRRIAHQAGRDPSSIQNLIISDKIPQFASLDHLDAVEALILEYAAEVLVVDPAMMAMNGADAANLFIQGQLLRGISEVCQRNGCTLALCHHSKKGAGVSYEPLELASIAWAGFAEFARQWILVNRREPYVPGTGDHRLWLNVGGSVGHSGQWGLNIHEGNYGDAGGRVWEVDVLDHDDIDARKEDHKEAQAEAKRQKQLDTDKAKICQTLAKFSDGETKTTIRDITGLHSSRFNAALATLLIDGDVVSCEMQKSNRNKPYPAYMLAEE